MQREYIYSRLSADPDLCDIVEMFVEEMPDRVDALLAKLAQADWEGLRQTAHQIKGAAGSYGFDAISPCAGNLETAIRDGQPEDQIRTAVDELVDFCNRAHGGSPK